MPKYKKKVDSNQSEIVNKLREVGFSVEVDHDDILVGWVGFNFWYELKSKDALSKKTGEVLESSKRDSQKTLDKTWKGHRKYVSSFQEIFNDIQNHLKMRR